MILLVALTSKNQSESDNAGPVQEKSTAIQFAQRPITSQSLHTTHSIIQAIVEHMQSTRVDSDEESATYSVEERRRQVEYGIEEGSSGDISTAITVV